MLLTYVDESYCKQCYYVTALVCPDHVALPLASALDEVVVRAHQRFPEVSDRAELHGYEILQGLRDWEPLAKKHRARIGVYLEAFKAIAAHDVRVIIRGVHSLKLIERYQDRAFHPHSVALAQLLERIDTHAESVNELALIIADEPGQADQQPEYRDDLRRYQQDGTWGFRGRKLSRIVDTLHFAPSRESRLLQAADLVAYLHHRIATADRSASDLRSLHTSELIWSNVQPKVLEASLWTP